MGDDANYVNFLRISFHRIKAYCSRWVGAEAAWGETSRWGTVARYINFFHTACHRPAAALSLADPGLVQPAGRRSPAKRGTADPGRSAGAKVPGEERKDIQARATGHGRRLGNCCEGIKEKLK